MNQNQVTASLLRTTKKYCLKQNNEHRTCNLRSLGYISEWTAPEKLQNYKEKNVPRIRGIPKITQLI